MAGLVCPLLSAYFLVLMARILLSWFPLAPGGLFAGIQSLVYALTEPVLGPLRRVIPAVGCGGMGLDLSPLIVLVGIQIVQGMICR